jgi:hypothetical protein
MKLLLSRVEVLLSRAKLSYYDQGKPLTMIRTHTNAYKGPSEVGHGPGCPGGLGAGPPGKLDLDPKL